MAVLLTVGAGCGLTESEDPLGPPYGLYRVSVDGTGLVRLTATDLQENHVQVSPDGARFLLTRFTWDVNGDGVVNEADVEGSATVVRAADGSGPRVVSDESSASIIDYGAVWSSDGTRIAVASNRDRGPGGTLDIYVMNADGSDVRNLTETPDLNEWDPHWLGPTIAFNRYDPFDPSSQPGIWLMDEDGSNQRQITFPRIPDDGSGAILGDTDPKLSPDGARVVFTRKLDGTSNGGNGNFDLFRVDVDGRNLVDLTPTPEAEIGGQWSPDGSEIVFWVIHGDAEGNQSLAVMSADGGNRRRIRHRLDAALWEEMPGFFPFPERGGYPVVFDAVEGAALPGAARAPALLPGERRRYRYPVAYPPWPGGGMAAPPDVNGHEVLRGLRTRTSTTP